MRQSHKDKHRRQRSDSQQYHGRRRSRSRSSSDNRKKQRYHYDDYRSRNSYERGSGRGDRGDRSRSRSKERRGESSYDDRKVEEKEQRIRLAIRNSTISYDTELFELYSNLSQAKKNQLTSQAQSIQCKKCVLVRQLYVSGLYETSEEMIQQFFGKYGEIEDVEIIKNFIFVKYFKVEDASSACADYHNINTTLHQTHNPGFKIFFADHLKRFNVVSNSPAYEVKEHLVSVVYASIKNDPQYTNEQYLSGIFGKYGFIRTLEVKRNELPTQRTYVLVQYETMAMAYRARDKLKMQREKLGDRKSEITILLDTDKMPRIFPSILHQLRYQWKRQQTISGQLGMQANMAMSHMVPPEAFYSQPPPVKNTEDIFAMIKEFAEKEEPEEEHMESDWFGFFTRNKQFKVEVDFYRIHKEPFQLESILNVSHRADLKQGLNRNDYVLAGKFKAANQANQPAFQQYVDYFIKKDRAGIIFSKSYLIYLLPPLQELNLPYSIQDNQLLALFFKISI